jgi:hypothetical protein
LSRAYSLNPEFDVGRYRTSASSKTVKVSYEITRILKYLSAVAQPAYWSAITRGVMPTVEHLDALKSL